MLKMIKKHLKSAITTAAPAATAKRSQAKKPVRRLVHFDAYGNALPNVPAVRDGKVKASSRKRVTIAHKSTPTKTVARKKPRTQVVKATARKAAAVMPTPSEMPTDTMPAKIKHAVQELHHHFDQREQELLVQVDKAFHVHQQTARKRSRRQGWLLASVASVGALGFAYLLYLMSSMQTSMVAMSGNMSTMAADTQTMSQGIQTMNGSMAHMSNNVAYMNNNVAHMNHQMGAMTQAVAPMGEAAQTASPFMKAFRSFMPF